MLMAERCKPIPAAPREYATHHATHLHPARRAKPRFAPARSPPDQVLRLPVKPIPAAHAASRQHAPAAPPGVRRPGRHTDSHSRFHARTAMAPAYLPPRRESLPKPFRAARALVLPDPLLR